MRKILAITVVVMCVIGATSAHAKPDLAMTAALDKYIENRVMTETIKVKRHLEHHELCAVMYRAIQDFKAQLKRNSGLDLEKKMTLEALVRMRRLESECGPYKDVPIKRDGPAPSPAGVEPEEGIIDTRYTEDDTIEAEALRDFMKWHPDEWVPDSAKQAGDFAALRWDVHEGRELWLRCQDLDRKVAQAEDMLEVHEQQKTRMMIAGEDTSSIDAIIATMTSGLRELERQRDLCWKALYARQDEVRSEAARKWARKNPPLGTAADMKPTTSSGQARQYTDSGGARVTEYNDGGKTISYPDGREETVEENGTQIIEYPDGRVERYNADGSIEVTKDHPDGILRIVTQKDGETDWYLNGVAVAHFWPEFWQWRFMRHAKFINRATGLLPIEVYDPMRQFWHWLNEEERRAAEEEGEEEAAYLSRKFEEFKAAHPGVFENETFDQFYEREKFERQTAFEIEHGRSPNAEERNDIARAILEKWNSEHSEEEMGLSALIKKRAIEARLQNGTSPTQDDPSFTDTETLKAEIDAYNDWLRMHPPETRTAEEEQERRREAARLRGLLKIRKQPLKSVIGLLAPDGKPPRNKEARALFTRLTNENDSLPDGIADDTPEGSVDPLSEDWPGPKPVSSYADFTSLDGMTRINGALIGPVDTIIVTGVDGARSERSANDDGDVQTQQAEDGDVLLNVAPGLDVAAIELSGQGRNVILRVDSSAEPSQEAIAPLDGDLDNRNGRVRETFRVSAALTDLTQKASANKVYVAQGVSPVSQNPIGTIAVRQGEIATYGEPAGKPIFGEQQCVIETPGNAPISSDIPAWGYEVTPQPVTHVNTWAPIFLRLYGLDFDEQVRIRLNAAPEVELQPRDITVTAGDFVIDRQLGQYRTPILGPQPIQVNVEPLD